MSHQGKLLNGFVGVVSVLMTWGGWLGLRIILYVVAGEVGFFVGVVVVGVVGVVVAGVGVVGGVGSLGRVM